MSAPPVAPVGPSPKAPEPHPRVWVVGPGFFLMGGLSVYTCRLTAALADCAEVSVLLLRKLIPARLYPGGARAGQDLTSLRYDRRVRIVGELDWFWGLRLLRVLGRLRADRPDLLVLQWWTAATLHTYLVLAFAARLLGVPVTIEFHEVQDTGEAAVPFVERYCRTAFPWLLARTTGGLVHNQHDLDTLRAGYGSAIDGLRLEIAPHGPYDHFTPDAAATDDGGPATGPAQDDGVTRLLFFGLIRPYKGLEDLVEAFNGLTDEQARSFRLTVVGETWENWDRPAEAIAASPHPDRITFVNRYVSDAEAARHFADADALVLPYRRGSASGPLQIAMSCGIHVILADVGGLTEAVADYRGVRLVPPGDVLALRQAILELPARRAERFEDPHSWTTTTAAVTRLAAALAPVRAG